jgi:hypothetical protein
VQNKKAHERSHHGHTEIIRHSPRDGFTAYNVISPVIGLCCHRRQRDTSRRLERQRRGVRTTRLRRAHSCSSSTARQRPSHPAPNVRDDRETPLDLGQDDLLSIPASSGPSSGDFWNSELKGRFLSLPSLWARRAELALGCRQAPGGLARMCTREYLAAAYCSPLPSNFRTAPAAEAAQEAAITSACGGLGRSTSWDRRNS